MVEHEPEPVPAELIVITSYEPDAGFDLETLSLPQDEPAARREGAQALIEYMVTARTRPAAAVATALKLTAAGVVLSGIRGEAAPAARSILARCGGWPRTEAVELRELERHWQALGEEDPLWAILTSPGKRGHGWDPGEFMATGRADVTFVMDRLAERGLAISRERALDFGCGVGRLTQALAEHFVECEGVDLARAMIEHAQRRNRLGDRVRYHHNPAGDLRVFGDRSFDFALSLFTFQHMEPRLMRGYLHEIVRILRPGGIAYFSIPERQMSGDPQRIPERRMSGDPLPAEAWQAEISLRCELPRLVRGQSVFLDLAVRNVSPVAWPAAAGLNLGNHWRTAEGELLARDDVRVPIAVDLAPGEETHLRIELAAPGDRRQYLLELDLVQEDVSWFADRGSRLRQIMIETVASPAESCSSANLGRFVPAIEMHALAPSDVAATVKAAGAGVIASFAVNRCGPEWPSLDYIVSR
jgi:SAM-dependent methyltransferase